MQSLIERAQSGEAEAMEALLASIAPSIHRFGIRLCHNDEDAQDVLQDALITIANHLNEFEGRSSFSSWAFTLARSACSRKRRGLKNQPHFALDEAPEGSLTLPNPEQQASDRQMADALNAALDSLPEMYREVILLRDVEELTAPEAAEVLGITVEAVKSRLHRARRALRESLKPVLEPRPSTSTSTSTSTCPDVLALWSSKLEGDLSPTDCAAMEKHMESCSSCASACEALKAALFACRRAGTREVRPELQAQVKAAVQKWIVQEGCERSRIVPNR